MNPLVSVICLCYNHDRFIKEALNSVLHQTYAPIEIIIIDDASTDGSPALILEFIKSNPFIQFIQNKKNAGSCSSFNKGFQLSKGKYLIDFATDDVMYPDKIARQVEIFEKLDESYGVVFSNAENINEESILLKKHFKNEEIVPHGQIYQEVIKRFFIPTVTMMVKREVYEALGGYDESLSYEDFDFWVRSSNKYKYHYMNEILMKRRIVKGSLSSRFLHRDGNPMLESSYRVCEKAMWLNKNKEEEKALVRRLNIEMRLAFLMENFNLVKKYGILLRRLNTSSIHSILIESLSAFPVRVHWLYKRFMQLRGR